MKNFLVIKSIQTTELELPTGQKVTFKIEKGYTAEEDWCNTKNNFDRLVSIEMPFSNSKKSQNENPIIPIELGAYICNFAFSVLNCFPMESVFDLVGVMQNESCEWVYCDDYFAAKDKHITMRKSKLEKYIKRVKQEIINNEMEIVPLRMMLNENDKIIIGGYLAKQSPFKTADQILRQYV